MIEGRGGTGGAGTRGGGKRLKRAIRGALYCELGSSIRGELIGEQIREVLSGSEFVDGVRSLFAKLPLLPTFGQEELQGGFDLVEALLRTRTITGQTNPANCPALFLSYYSIWICYETQLTSKNSKMNKRLGRATTETNQDNSRQSQTIRDKL